MRTRAQWALAGVLAGLGGLATSYLTATWLGLRGNPVTDVAELVIRLTPGPVAEDLIKVVGRHDKPLLVTGVLVVVLLLFAAFGLLSRRWQGAGIVGFVVLAVIGLIANQSTARPPPGSCRAWSASSPGWRSSACSRRTSGRNRFATSRPRTRNDASCWWPPGSVWAAPSWGCWAGRWAATGVR